MEYEKRENRPGNGKSGDEWEPLPVCLDTGCHVPCQSQKKDARGYRSKIIPCLRDTNALAEYGLGVSLYFKYLRFMRNMFLILVLINAPGAAFWYLGTEGATGLFPSDNMISDFNLESADAGLGSYLGFLGFFTSMGSWGDGDTKCYTGLSEGDEIQLDCGERGGRITSITAFYGAPSGFCSCPVENRVDAETGLCPDGLNGPKQMTYGGKDLVGENTMCCYENSLRLDGINIYDEDTCFSATAKYIAAGKCKNKGSCSLTVDHNHEFRWDNKFNCDAYTKAGDCKTTFMYDKNGMSDFSGCADSCTWSQDAKLWSCESYDNMEFTVVATCEKVRIWGWAREGVSAICSSLDAFSMLILWAMLVWLELKQKAADKMQNADVCSPGDYTIMITGLPSAKDDATLESDLRAHFQKIVEATKPMGKGDKERCISEEVVFDVQFAHSNASLIHNKILQGSLARKVDVAEAQYGLYMLFKHGKKSSNMTKKTLSDCFDRSKRKAFETRLSVLKMLIGNRAARIEKQEEDSHKKKALFAYVTFDSEEAYMRCRKAYPNLGSFVNFFQPSYKRLHHDNPEGRKTLRKYDKELKQWEKEDREPYPDVISNIFPCLSCIFGKGYRLRVVECTEPEDIIWEHLGYTGISRAIRTMISFLIMIGFIAISFAVILYGNIRTEQEEAKFPVCPRTYSKYAFGDKSDDTYNGQMYWGKDTEGEPVVAYYGYVDGDSDTLTVQDVIKDYNWEEYTDDGVEGNSGLLACMCTFMTNNLDTNPYKSLEKMLDYKFYVDLNPGSGSGIGASNDAKNYCRNYYWSYVTKLGVTTAIVITIAAINIAIEYVAKFCAKLERHGTYSAEITSTVNKQFIGTFLNTAIIIIVISGSLRGILPGSSQRDVEDITVGVQGRPLFFGGTIQDMNSSWFKTVGVALVATLFSQSFIAPASNTSEYVTTKLKRWYDRGFSFRTTVTLKDPATGKLYKNPTAEQKGHVSHQVTQAALNKMYMGGEFKLSKRYAQQLALVFSLLLYSAGMPILYLFGFVAFALYFFFDKFLFTRYYKTPEKFDASLAIMAVNALPYAIFLHLSFSLWMYSNPHIFNDSDDEFVMASNSTTSADLADYADTATTLASTYSKTSIFGHDLFRDAKQTQRIIIPFIVWIISLVHLIYRDIWIPLFNEIGHMLVPLVAVVSAIFPCCHLEQCIDRGADFEDNPDFLKALELDKLKAIETPLQPFPILLHQITTQFLCAPVSC